MAQSNNEGLQDLLASLSPASTTRTIRQENNPFTRSTASNEASDGNATMSSTTPQRTPSVHSTTTQSASLLNLLRFNSSGGTPTSQLSTAGGTPATGGQQARVQNIHGRGVSSSDLVASFMGKPTISQSAGNATPASIPDVASSGGNPQDYLLQLLNRTSSSQGRVPTQKSLATPVAASPALQTFSAKPESIKAEAQKESAQFERQNSPIRVFGSTASRETTPFEPEVPSVKVNKPEQPSMFNYVNPFEQLAADSPLKGRSGTTTPAKGIPSRPASLLSRNVTPALETPKSPLNVNGHGILQSIEGSIAKSPAADRLADLGAPTNDKATVAQALNEVGEQVNRQVEYALAQQQPVDEEIETPAAEPIEEQLQQAASEIKKELKGDEMDTLSTLVSREKAAEIKSVLDEAAAGNVDGHHGSADDEEEDSPRAEDDVEVPVYNFPLRPFISIDILADKVPVLSFRDSSITDIARLKKEFDQVDRYLATASTNYIVYSLPKPGGFRVIRQEDGIDRQAFKETKDHVFNVAICNEAHNRKNKIGLETCIATAVSGKVYWVTLRKDGEDLLEQGNEFERNTLVFPPVPAHDDNTSGGQLKTRAKTSSRHPDYFAIGRGKAIHIVYPLRIQNSDSVSNKGVVDVKKYLSKYSVKINTGKAGKDFTFSEDDSVIATLDKSGRLRLWDITDLVENTDDSDVSFGFELKDSVLSFPTTSGSSKSWPTSVLFVDKPRAYTKGCAQRYVIVGLKQNHTLQLWDLGLAKPVQEIHFPHEKESDGICSIGYHHHSNILVVGHPTRNSIYFMTLSAPKYNLLGISEAKYIQRLASNDPTLPRPESTAILSGVREYSFASKGQLRSVEILPTTNDGSVDEERGLFELYVMHSKGVTCLSIRKSDLGWADDNKVIISKNAEEEGYIVLKELREIDANRASEASSVSGETVTASSARASAKAKKVIETKLEAQLNSSSTSSPATPENSERVEKRNKKKRTTTQLAEETSVPPPAPIPPTSTELNGAATNQSRDIPQAKKTEEAMETTRQSEPVSTPLPHHNTSDSATPVSQDLLGLIQHEFEGLRVKVNNDYADWNDKAKEKQIEVLRLVSSQLGDNVEKSLSRIVAASMASSVVPSIHNITASTLRSEIPDWLSKQLLQTLPSQLKLALPEAVTKTISSPEVLKFMADQITAKISNHVEKQFSNSLQNTIIPSFQTMVVEIAQKKMQEAELRIGEEIRVVNAQHEDTLVKLNQLTAMVQNIGEAVVAMAESQQRFQAEIKGFPNGINKVPGDASVAETEMRTTSSATPAPQQLSPVMLEIKTIEEYMVIGDYEQGVITWLQSKFQTEIFDDFFVKYDPSFLRGCSSLVALSVIAAVTITLHRNITQRLQWLEVILDFIDVADHDIRQVAPRIMEVLCQRMETRFMELTGEQPDSPDLRRFPALVKRARELAMQCATPA